MKLLSIQKGTYADRPLELPPPIPRFPNWAVLTLVVVATVLGTADARAIRPYGLTNSSAPASIKTQRQESGTLQPSFSDRLEHAISQQVCFSVHGKLADITFPNWWAVLASAATPLLFALLLAGVHQPSKLAALGPERSVGFWRLVVAWFVLGAFLGAVFFGGFDFGIVAVCLGVGLAWLAHHLRCSGNQGYPRLVRWTTLFFLLMAPGVVPHMLTGTFINLDYRAMLAQQPKGRAAVVLNRVANSFPELASATRTGRISIQFANGSAGPLATLHEPVIGPTTFTLDQRMVEADLDRAAMCLAHELKHTQQRGRRWPGIIGTLMLDLSAGDVLSLEWETAIFEAQHGKASVEWAGQKVPTHQDFEAFYPEGQISPFNMNLRRVGAAVLSAGAYLLWPKLKFFRKRAAERSKPDCVARPVFPYFRPTRLTAPISSRPARDSVY